jgi:hypothetical protein
VSFFVTFAYQSDTSRLLPCNLFINDYSVYATMNNHKISLALVVTGVVLAVALAPMLLSSALAARTTTCTNGGGHTKDCGTPPAKCETVKAGNGKGGGEIKSSTC